MFQNFCDWCLFFREQRLLISLSSMTLLCLMWPPWTRESPSPNTSAISGKWRQLNVMLSLYRESEIRPLDQWLLPELDDSLLTRAVTITALPLHRGSEMPTAVLRSSQGSYGVWKRMEFDWSIFQVWKSIEKHFCFQTFDTISFFYNRKLRI